MPFDGSPLGDFPQQLVSDRLGETEYDEDTSARNALGHVLVGCCLDAETSQINRLRPPDPDFRLLPQNDHVVGVEVTRAVDRLAKKYIGDIDELRLKVEETISSDGHLQARLSGCHVAFVFFATLGGGPDRKRAAAEIIELFGTADLSNPHIELMLPDSATFPVLARYGIHYALVRTHETGRRQIWKSVKGTKRHAEQVLAQMLTRASTGVALETGRITVQAFIDKWLDHINTRVRPSTATRYTQLLKIHVVPNVGSKRLVELRPLDIQSLYSRALSSGNQRSKKGLSNRTVLHLHRVLFSALKQAVRWRILAVSPCDVVEPPRPTRKEMRTLDDVEMRKLIEHAKGSRLHLPIALALVTGMRRGELLGLQWTDVDFEGSRIWVRRSLQPDGTLGEPKTARSRRTVSLPASITDLIRQHKVAQNAKKLNKGPAYMDRGLVFAHADGSPWKPASISTLFHGITKRASMGHLRFHDLRHTAASLMLERGVPITTVAEMLGHSSTATTMAVYAHAIKGSQERAVSAMDSILQGLPASG